MKRSLFFFPSFFLFSFSLYSGQGDESPRASDAEERKQPKALAIVTVSPAIGGQGASESDDSVRNIILSKIEAREFKAALEDLKQIDSRDPFYLGQHLKIIKIHAHNFRHREVMTLIRKLPDAQKRREAYWKVAEIYIARAQNSEDEAHRLDCCHKAQSTLIFRLQAHGRSRLPAGVNHTLAQLSELFLKLGKKLSARHTCWCMTSCQRKDKMRGKLRKKSIQL